MKFLRKFLILTLSVLLVSGGIASRAHANIGTIDPDNLGKYKAAFTDSNIFNTALTINFGKFTNQSARNITVSDTELRGYAWGEGAGWIVMNCADTTSGCSSANSNFKVANDGDGNLSGYAWGENTGWINFGPFTNQDIDPVKIISGIFGGRNGQKRGYAWSQNFGFIVFDCGNPESCVTTDWTPSTTPPTTYQCNDGIDNDGDGLIDYPADPGCSSATDDDETNSSGPGGGSAPICHDFIDNDGDGLVDFPNDPGCDSYADSSEIDTPPANICADPSAVNVGGALPCVYPNNPTTCSDINALNFGGVLPCQYPGNSTTCTNTQANNYGGPLPCTFGTGGPTTCTDINANNYGGPLPCTFNTGGPTTCADTNAINVGGPLPCQYPTTFCQQNPTDPTCTGGPTLTFCQRYPELCVTTPPSGPGTPTIVQTSVAVSTGSIGKIISFVGLSSVPIASAVTFLLANPFSWFDIGLLIARLWSLILIFFGIRKKNNPWGTVYDSITKQPIDPAYVVLFDTTGNEVATAITDIDGRYGFAVPAGTYTILVNKTNFVFPSVKLAGKSQDEVYNELYFGGPITVKEDGGVILKNIPMDQLNFDWNEYAKNQQHRLRHYGRQDRLVESISNIFFVIGFIITAIAVSVSPIAINIIMMSLYIVFAIAQIFGYQIRPKGSVKDSATKHALPFSIVRVISNVTNKEVLHRVADAKGEYYALVANGKYRITIDKKNLDQSYSPNTVPGDVNVRKGYMKEHFKI